MDKLELISLVLFIVTWISLIKTFSVNQKKKNNTKFRNLYAIILSSIIMLTPLILLYNIFNEKF